MASYVVDRPLGDIDGEQVDAIIDRLTAPLDRSNGKDVYELRDDLEETMWECVGVVRTEEKLHEGLERLADIRDSLDEVAVSGSRRYNLEWNEFMDLENLVTAAEMVARSALHREESRGAHYRDDYSERDDDEWLVNVHVQRTTDGMDIWTEDVRFTRVHPSEIAGAVVPEDGDPATDVDD